MIENHIIPFRLIITTQCNGSCYFCHKEGANTPQDMPLELIKRCSAIANSISAPISITGGEPTLRKDLNKIINEIHKVAPNNNLSLTTNGFRLIDFCNSIETSIDTLNLSITSLNNSISLRYQNVKPEKALHSFECFPAINKNLNIVVVQDNYREINSFIDYCVKQCCDLDLMFELKSYTKDDLLLQKYIFDLIEGLGKAKIILKPSPVLEIDVNENTKIRLKHPYLSAIPKFDFCQNCNEILSCYERICSLRIYPNGYYSPCLKKRIATNSSDFEHDIIEAYKNILNNFSLLSFIID